MTPHGRALGEVMSSSSEGGSAMTRRRRRLTESQESYVKALYDLGGARGRVKTSALARCMHVSVASATEMLGRLDALDLVRHNPYRGAILTARGEAVATEMVRHHRLLETYLVEKLGYRWDEVHEDAERLEHVMSERMERGLSEALGHPAVHRQAGEAGGAS